MGQTVPRGGVTMLTVATFPRKRQSTGAADPGSATYDQDHLSFQRPAHSPPLLTGAPTSDVALFHATTTGGADG